MIGRFWRRLFEKRDKMTKREDGSEGRGRGKDAASPSVVWQISNDGLEPRVAPWGFILRNPVQVSILPRQTRRIDMNVAGDIPMLAWPVRNHTNDTMVEGGMIVPPGTTVSVLVTNSSEHSALVVDDGEALVCLHPMFFSGCSVVG